MSLASTPFPPVPGVQRIAVVRANALGDLLFAMPALESLRAAYPLAEIVLLAQPWHAEFLAGRPSPVDRVAVIPGPLEAYDEFGAFYTAMRDEQFDLALQMHGGGRHSNPFTRRLAARLSAGLRSPDAAPLDRCVPYVYFQPEVARCLEVAALVGTPPVTLTPRIGTLPADREASEAVVPPGPEPLVAIHPGASDPRRRWPAERFAVVARELVGVGAHVVVTGTPPEAALTQAVVDRAGTEGVENLAGALSLSALTGMLARCSLVISNDTGPLHLAVALGVPTVGIYWCGNLVNGAPLTRTRHRPVASWMLDCPVCGIRNTNIRCEHDVSFVADISADEILIAAHDLLGRPGLDRPRAVDDGDDVWPPGRSPVEAPGTSCVGDGSLGTVDAGLACSRRREPQLRL